MFISKKHLDRRTFLRGAGTVVALPLLDSMVPAATAQSLTAAGERLRFGAVYVPNGIYPGMWHPEQAGKDFEFNQIMKPLEPYRQHLTTISQLKAPDGGKDMGGIHMGASAAFLNGVGPLSNNGDFNIVRSKKTVDQYIADTIAGDTPLRSLELGTEDMGTSVGSCDGYPCLFFSTLSWLDDESPLPVSINPQVTFERMYGDPGTPEQRLARMRRKQSMLDSVLDETKRLQRVIGASDNAILDEYLTNIRRVEQQLQKMEMRSDVVANAPEGPVGIPEDFDTHMTVTYDLLHLAFQGDISRVFSFLTGHEASGRSYAFLGVTEPHHTTSHHKDTPETLDQYARVNSYQMVKLAEFLGKLESTPDGDGTLLDSSLIYFGAGMSNGPVHDRHNVPAVMLGRAGGRLEGNRHIEAEKDIPTANLLLAMADMLGSEVASVGHSTGRLQI
ncbi:DUF1552 domain-containing protein [Candidatus Rariloculus sp.]|uniref:DUF1552 domain-containing protein n=1 Tax=Candidatus Rariloculus sp. TaxID=3101265 RepID=UPI003D13116A